MRNQLSQLAAPFRPRLTLRDVLPALKLRKSISLCDTGHSLHNKDAMTVSVNKLPGDQSATQCPECGGTSVVSVTVTSMCVYLRCRDCSHTWSIPERRAGTRETDVSKVL